MKIWRCGDVTTSHDHPLKILASEKWRRHQISTVMLTPLLLTPSSNDDNTPARDSGTQPSRASVGVSAQLQFSPDLVVMGAILLVRRCGVTVSPRFNMLPFAALIHLALHQILKQRDIKMDMTIWRFYMALSRKAKGSKCLCEAKRELQGPPPKWRRFPNQAFPSGTPPVGWGGAQQTANNGGYQQSQNFRGRPRSGWERGHGTASATSTSATAGASASQSGQ